MKLISAIIKHFKLDDVREAISGIGVKGITFTEVKGFSRQKGHTELYRGAEYLVDFLPKLKLELPVSDDTFHQTVDTLVKAAHSGSIADGKVLVTDLEQAMRIRTSERGADAL